MKSAGSTMKRGVLLDLYKSRGATLIGDADRLLPRHFGDPIAEYDAVRNHVGIFDLSQRNLFRATGHDYLSVLDRVVSNDLNALVPGRGLHAAFLDPTCKILADARIFCAPDSLIIDIPESRKEMVLWYLTGVDGAEVHVQDLVADYMMLSLQGPHAEPLIANVTSTNVESPMDLAHLRITIAGSSVILITITHGAERGYDLIIPLARLKDVVAEIENVGKRWSLCWVGVEAQEILRVEAGIPLFGTDITENTLLLESGQERWISFNKQFAGLILESQQVVRNGAKIYDGEREIGIITSCRFSPALDAAIALGSVRKDYLHPGARVMVGDGVSSLPATISKLPFTSPH
jgi:glycine cleavage system aminomethyltransferase T